MIVNLTSNSTNESGLGLDIFYYNLNYLFARASERADVFIEVVIIIIELLDKVGLVVQSF